MDPMWIPCGPPCGAVASRYPKPCDRHSRTARETAAGRRTGTDVRTACKPDSVPGLPPSMTIPLVPPLPAGSSCQPGVLGPKLPCGDIPGPAAGISPRGPPIRHCSRWGLPCRSRCRSRGGLLPHRFTLASGEPSAVSSLWRFPWGCPRRALPGTVAPRSPDFPRASGCPGGPRSSGHPHAPPVMPRNALRQPGSAGRGRTLPRGRLPPRDPRPRGGSGGGMRRGASRAAPRGSQTPAPTS